jgi:hypothetical protein
MSMTAFVVPFVVPSAAVAGDEGDPDVDLYGEGPVATIARRVVASMTVRDALCINVRP